MRLPGANFIINILLRLAVPEQSEELLLLLYQAFDPIEGPDIILSWRWSPRHWTRNQDRHLTVSNVSAVSYYRPINLKNDESWYRISATCYGYLVGVQTTQLFRQSLIVSTHIVAEPAPTVVWGLGLHILDPLLQFLPSHFTPRSFRFSLKRHLIWNQIKCMNYSEFFAVIIEYLWMSKKRSEVCTLRKIWRPSILIQICETWSIWSFKCIQAGSKS